MRFLWLAFLGIQVLCTNAQSVRTYSLNKLGEKDRLVKTDFFENGKLVRSNQINEEGKIQSTTRHSYIDDLLVKTIKTFKIGHEYDYIWEYAYDDQGRKIHQLSGNNRTGKWQSLGYNYNLNGQVDTFYLYQKNGDLTAKTSVHYQYNNKNLPISIKKTLQSLPDNETSLTSWKKITYPNANTKIIQELNKSEVVLQTERYTYEGALLIKEIIELPDNPSLITEYQYNRNNKIQQTQAFTGTRLDYTISYKYDSKGRLIKKRYEYANKSYSGEAMEYNN